MNIIIIGQYYILKCRIKYILGRTMNIFKFEKNSIRAINNYNTVNNTSNFKKIENKLIFFSKIELTSILNFLKSLNT